MYICVADTWPSFKITPLCLFSTLPTPMPLQVSAAPSFNCAFPSLYASDVSYNMVLTSALPAPRTHRLKAKFLWLISRAFSEVTPIILSHSISSGSEVGGRERKRKRRRRKKRMRRGKKRRQRVRSKDLENTNFPKTFIHTACEWIFLLAPKTVLMDVSPGQKCRLESMIELLLWTTQTFEWCPSKDVL